MVHLLVCTMVLKKMACSAANAATTAHPKSCQNTRKKRDSKNEENRGWERILFFIQKTDTEFPTLGIMPFRLEGGGRVRDGITVGTSFFYIPSSLSRALPSRIKRLLASLLKYLLTGLTLSPMNDAVSRCTLGDAPPPCRLGNDFFTKEST